MSRELWHFSVTWLEWGEGGGETGSKKNLSRKEIIDHLGVLSSSKEMGKVNGEGKKRRFRRGRINMLNCKGSTALRAHKIIKREKENGAHAGGWGGVVL